MKRILVFFFASLCAPGGSSHATDARKPNILWISSEDHGPQMGCYYRSNNSKEDYNLTKPGQVWDGSSDQAHWKNRSAGQPFFAVFNAGASHESQIRIRPHKAIHDPARVRVPAYHPDTPEVRQDWAQYYDTVTEAERRHGVRPYSSPNDP